MRIGVTMPILNQPYANFPEFARLADEAGFDSLWDYEFFRSPFVMHGVCARETERIQHATGIATACSRTPFEMANAAADLDELTGGRAILGLAHGAEMFADTLNGVDISHPLPRIREYIELLRAQWKWLSDGEPFSYEGRFYSAASPAMNPWGVRTMVRPRIPIYLSVVRPRMLELTGEVAEGWLGYFCTPRYLADVARPHLETGATRVGRSLGDIDRAALVICSVCEDRAEAMRRARIQVGSYMCFGGADPMVQFEGLGEQRDQLVQGLLTSGFSAFDALPEETVKTFAVCGTPDEAREQVAQYEGLLDHAVLHTPYVPPLAQADSEECFRNIIATFAHSGVR
jgi:alkanesulfonate monooxygenase SsuD/methylene tetrahydromethanopterin reductase-like flavin-dependent oxidoreductase (luciferase family)